MRCLDNNKELNEVKNKESSDVDSILLHENYLKLKQIAEGIMTDRYHYMKLKAPGFMDLVIEKIGDNRISLSHYYEQNGDLMADPDVEIIVDHNSETARAATFQQDNMAIYQSAYNGDQLTDEYLAKELDDFLGDWLKNIKAQGHIPYKAYYSSGIMSQLNNVKFDEEGQEIVADIVEDDDLEM